jgi:hypothetical protein
MMIKRKFPIGIQDFPKLREGGFCYVDKTERILELITESAGPVFLARPRRFGKSMLCATLCALFDGRRNLFQECAGMPGLAINTLDWSWKKYPVVKIDLNVGDYPLGTNELYITINRALQFAAEKYDITCSGGNVSDAFIKLIKNLNKKFGERVVVIIDEYDKPLLNTIDVPEIHAQMRGALKSFYGVLKASDEYLGFVFITGVTKFSQVSIFSDLNNLTDISLNPKYCDICGITQDELERDFENEIQEIAKNNYNDKQAYLDELKRFYNGYRFSQAETTVYNPFGILKHIHSGGLFENYWFETGTPTFLVKLIEAQHIDILKLENYAVNVEAFGKFDVENMPAVPVLYQSGYLTIKSYNNALKEYLLDYPNEEVRSAFSRFLVKNYLHVSGEIAQSFAMDLSRSLFTGDVETALNLIRSFFASIPYDLIVEKEKYFQLVIHLVFRMLGYKCRSEVRTATGRIDTLVETCDYVYCFEFKLNGNAEDALKQIDDKEYLLPWKGTGKKLIKAGVSFDYEKRNISEWKVAEC